MKNLSNSFVCDILQKMKADCGGLIEQYVLDNIEKDTPMLQKLRMRLEETGGSGNLLLANFLPQRVKFYENGRYSRISFIVPIVGAEEYIVVYDCASKQISIQEGLIETWVEC